MATWAAGEPAIGWLSATEWRSYELMFDNRFMEHQPPHVLAWRGVLNMHWPPEPAVFRHRDKGIAVRVRIVWDRDGEEYFEGVATRWDADHVYVEVRDKRLQGNGVWVKPCDVYRHSPEPVTTTQQRNNAKGPQ